ncbi:MAG: hypothetical protein LC679_16705, partial [Intrasporangiaceae bacterium]|nr:hypothetical protein [Intrasporangiaceae bacterium]
MSQTSHYHQRMTLRLLLAAGVGVAVALGSLLAPLDPAARVLAGVCTALLAYSLPLLVLFVRLDEAERKRHFAQVDPSRSETELLVILGALTGLIPVAVDRQESCRVRAHRVRSALRQPARGLLRA